MGDYSVQLSSLPKQWRQFDYLREYQVSADMVWALSPHTFLTSHLKCAIPQVPCYANNTYQKNHLNLRLLRGEEGSLQTLN